LTENIAIQNKHFVFKTWRMLSVAKKKIKNAH